MLHNTAQNINLASLTFWSNNWGVLYNNGIVTTQEELNYYHIIKTLLVQSKRIISDRISYKDQKNSFAIVVDGNIRKSICSLIFNDKTKKIQIGNKITNVEKIDDVLNLKKDLIDSALPYFEIS